MKEVNNFKLKIFTTNDTEVISEPISKQMFARIIGVIYSASLDATLQDKQQVLEIEKKQDQHTSSLSINEFLNSYGPTTQPQRIVVMALYLKDFRRIDPFFTEDIKNLYIEAREVLSKNFSRDFSLAVKAGLLAKNPNDSSYYLTNSGKHAIENKFSTTVFKSSLKGKIPKKPKAKKATVINDKVSNIEIDPESADFSTYQQLESKSDKILLLLKLGH